MSHYEPGSVLRLLLPRENYDYDTLTLWKGAHSMAMLGRISHGECVIALSYEKDFGLLKVLTAAGVVGYAIEGSFWKLVG